MFLSKNLFAVRAASAALSRCGFGPAHRTSLSFRDGSNICATKDDAKLGLPGWDDLVESSLYRKNVPEEKLSSALVTHRVIYLSTHHGALVQATPPRALAMTLEACPQASPRAGRGHAVIEPEPDTAADRLVDRLSCALKRRSLVLIRGIAAYAAAQDLETAADLMCDLEQGARDALAARDAK